MNYCILGIETSCDETGVAIYDQHKGVIANEVYSQSALHADYGGVVPELAAREHILKIIPIILSVFKKTGLKYSDITGIAYTAGPGLANSLLIGATVARSLAYAWDIPSIAVNHMEAHLLSPMLEKVTPKFPYIGLLVSGGHTQLILARGIGDYKILGETVDDAVGEAFDKIAVLLGIKYPGGSLLSKMAEHGVPGRYKFPRPMINKPGLNFSFSGLKTFAANIIMSSIRNTQNFADIAYEFERAAVDTLVIKCFRALNQSGLKTLVISGGVSANRVLRSCLLKKMHVLKGKLFYPKLEFCTDNGAMIAYVGYVRLKSEVFLNDLSIFVYPRWSLESLSKINF